MPDLRPLELYSQAEVAVEDGLRCLSGYAALGDGLTVGESVAVRPAPVASAVPLARPHVETVDVTRVLAAATSPRDADVRAVLLPISSLARFETEVLLPGYAGSGKHISYLRKARWREMRALRYIERMRRPPPHAFAANVFFVMKSCGTLVRLIWNGKPFNVHCKRPPSPMFSPFLEMLRALSDPSVKTYASYDFASWFVQLALPDELRGVFAIRGPDGVWYRLAGVPMGWCWAPAIAQAITILIIRETLGQLPAGDVSAAFGFIDNVIFACTTDAAQKRVDEAFRATCARFGAVIKEGILSPDQDWLGVCLTAGSRHATHRQKLIDAVRETQPRLRTALSARAIWRAVALAVHSLWLREAGLTTLIQPLQWVSRVARDLADGRATWSTTYVLPDPITAALTAAYATIQVPWTIRAVPQTVRAVGMSDAAALSAVETARSRFTAYIFRMFPNTIRAVRLGRVANGVHINRAETRAAAAGVVSAAHRCRDGLVRWASDNTTAVGWLNRRWSPIWEFNQSLADIHLVQRARNVAVHITHVPGVDCVADALTRCEQTECLHGDTFVWTWEATCQCLELCAHVVKELHDRVRRCPACRIPPRN